jgi:replicative DNA helicase
MTTLETALAYLEKGLSVIPLKSPSMVKGWLKFQNKVNEALAENETLPTPRSHEDVYNELFYRECKQPLLPGWKEYQTRLPTKEEVNHWFTLNPDANIGIITGKVSNVVVFDVDSPEADQYAEEQGGFPKTARVKTGKGDHYYVRHPGFHVNNQVKKKLDNIEEKLDLDVRGDGGYVVAPPSIHGSGRQYAWEEGHSIFQIDPPPCDEWKIEYLKKVNLANEKSKEKHKKEATTSPPKQESVNVTKQSDSGKIDFTKILSEGSAEGERNDTATRLSGHLLKTTTKDEAWAIVNLWNKNNKPPLTQDELKKTFDSIAKMEQNTKVSIDKFLDNPGSILSDYNQNYVRIPFAGTNLKNLEAVMNGGLASGGLNIFGGIPSSGKTLLLNNLADNICLNGYPVLFFSYDDGKSELMYRTLCRFSGVGIEEFNHRKVPDMKSILNDPSIKKILSFKYIVQEMIPVEKWPDLIEKIKQRHGKGPVIIIDYLRKLKTESKISDERIRVDDILGKLTNLAKKYNIPIVAISELARDSYKTGQRLSMASFKESGTIEYEASWLGILAAVKEGEKGGYDIKENWEHIIEHDGNVDLIIFKAKRGTGQTGRVQLTVNKNTMTVTDRVDEKAATSSSKKSIFGV